MSSAVWHPGKWKEMTRELHWLLSLPFLTADPNFGGACVFFSIGWWLPKRHWFSWFLSLAHCTSHCFGCVSNLMDKALSTGSFAPYLSSLSPRMIRTAMIKFLIFCPSRLFSYALFVIFIRNLLFINLLSGRNAQVHAAISDWIDRHSEPHQDQFSEGSRVGKLRPGTNFLFQLF